MNRGRFIVVEGAEGVGKSTQAGRLQVFLEGMGVPVVRTREPGGTAVGEGIRELVLHGSGDSISPATELLLILAARAAFVSQRVEPELAAGRWVVSDRFDLSTFAYQGYGRGIDFGLIETLNHYVTSGLVPDLYLVLDLSVDEGMARQVRQGKGPDRIESEGGGFLHRVRQGYLELARSRERAVLVPAGGSPEQVEKLIRREVARRFRDIVPPFGETFRGDGV